jgi:hypothetical protein
MVFLLWLTRLIGVSVFNRGGVPSAGGEVELVAFGVAKADPAVVVVRERADLLGTKTCQPIGLGLNVALPQVELDPVLDGLAFGHLVKHQQRPGPAVGAGGY